MPKYGQIMPLILSNSSGQFCDICGKEFRGKNSTVTYNLKRHKNSVHLHLRPFQCRRFPCQKMFGEKRNRDQHEKTVHDKIRKGEVFRPSFTMRSQSCFNVGRPAMTPRPELFTPVVRPSFPPPPPFTPRASNPFTVRPQAPITTTSLHSSTPPSLSQ